MRWVLLAFGTLFAIAIPAGAQAQGSGDWVIIEEGSPPAPTPAAQPVAPSQAKLTVMVEQPPAGVTAAIVYLDDVPVGPAPWTGGVAPGAHRVRAEAPGWASRSYRTKGVPGQAVTVSVVLLRDGQFDTGRFYVGLVYSFGVGSSYSSGERYRLNCPGIGPGLNFGMKLPISKFWLEAGMVAGPWTDRWIDYDVQSWNALSRSDQIAQKERVGKGMPLALELRLVSPILKPFLYWSASFQPGLLLYKPYKYNSTPPEEAEEEFGYMTTLDGGVRAIFTMSFRGGLAFFFVDWLEIRVDPIGLGMHCTKPFGVVYTPSFALVLRI